MKKSLLLKHFLLQFALFAGVGSMWAEDVTISFTDIAIATNWSNGSYIKDPITLTGARGTHTNTDPYPNGSQYRLYQGNTLTISTTVGTLKSIRFKTNSTAQYGPKCLSYNGTAITNDGTEYTWTVPSGLSSVTLSANSQARLTEIHVTYISVSGPSISANDVNIASDATSGEISYTITNGDESTMTATKKSGDWISNIAVDEDNNKVTFSATQNEGAERTGVITLTYGTATKDVTITQAACVAKYTVTIETPDNGTLVVKRGEDVVESGSQIPDGTVLTIVPTPAEGYKFYNWQAVDATTHTYTANYTYTINGHDVTFKANFVEIEYVQINWSVNGVVTSENVEKGSAITFSPASVPAGTSKVFVGWVTTPTVGESPEFVTSATAEEDITYYAVFADEDDSSTTATLTESEIKAHFTNAAMGYSDNAKSWEDTSDGITWAVKGYAVKDAPWIQLRKNNTVAYFKISSSSDIVKVKLTLSSSGVNTSPENVNFEDNTNFTGAVILRSSALANATEGDLGTSGNVDIKGDVTVNLTTPATDVYVQTTAGARIWGVEVTSGSVTYSNYCTTIAPTEIEINISVAGYKAYNTTMDTDFSETEGLTAFVVTEASATNITLTEVDAVPAGTPVILKGAAGDYTLKAAGLTPDGPAVNELKVSNGAVQGDGDTRFALGYIDNTVGFYRVGSGVTIPTNYLEIDGVTSNAIGFSFDEGTTGIVNVNRETITNNQYYTLDGRRVENPSNGIYIVNGKKVVIK